MGSSPKAMRSKHQRLTTTLGAVFAAAVLFCHVTFLADLRGNQKTEATLPSQLVASTYKHQIPRIIHHIWFKKITSKVSIEPLELKSSCFQVNCVGTNGGWTSMHWDEDKIKDLLSWPLIHHLWKKVEHQNNPRKLSDISRLAILWEYGGAYMDSDVACIKPLDMLLESPSLARATLIGGQEYDGPELAGLMINGIVFVTPRHPFIGWMLEALQRRPILGNDWEETGPMAWGQEMEAFLKAHPDRGEEIKILPSTIVCPLAVNGHPPPNFNIDPVWTINYFPGTTQVSFMDLFVEHNKSIIYPSCKDLPAKKRIQDTVQEQDRAYIESKSPKDDCFISVDKLRKSPNQPFS